jgi:hypothetical protein
MSVLAFLGLGGTMAANATQATSTDPTGASRATATTGADDGERQAEDHSSTDAWSGARPVAPVFGQTPISNSSGS